VVLLNGRKIDLNQLKRILQANGLQTETGPFGKWPDIIVE
jgi:hypothetical protein